MITIAEMEEILARQLDELPEVFFEGLNGGVCLSEEMKTDPLAGDSYILGEYVTDALGHGIVLYYGSFAALFGAGTRAALTRELRATLRHEFRHHLEGRAGLDDLEREDARQLAQIRAEDAARGNPDDARARGRREGRLFGRKRRES